MKIAVAASAVVLSLASLTSAASAAGIVPGSDYYTEAQADHEANTVIRGTTVADAPTGAAFETRSFGYPVATGSEDGIIPGSRTTTHAADTRATNSVSRGVTGEGNAVAPTVRSVLVPGSGSF